MLPALASRCVLDRLGLARPRAHAAAESVILSGANPADLGRRLREGDRSAAPAALNAIEDRSPAGRERAQALLAEVAPAAMGGEAPAHLVGVTGPPGAGKSSL